MYLHRTSPCKRRYRKLTLYRHPITGTLVCKWATRSGEMDCRINSTKDEARSRMWELFEQGEILLKDILMNTLLVQTCNLPSTLAHDPIALEVKKPDFKSIQIEHIQPPNKWLRLTLTLADYRPKPTPPALPPIPFAA